MKFKKQDIINLAALAKLKLSEDELSQFSHQLSDISAFVEQLNEIKIDLKKKNGQDFVSFKELAREDEVILADETEKELSLNQKKRQSGLVIAPKIY